MRSRYLAVFLCTSALLSGGSWGYWNGLQGAWAQETQEWTDDDTVQGDVADVQVFYEPLAPYGRWTTLTEYGSVWIPHDVPADWRPYMEGRWVYTRHGWTWVAEQPWGWAPFHYGRWAFVTYYGWVWIPGTVWGPAWVVWRQTPGWVGWAPLPPHVVFRAGIGLQGGYDERHFEPAWFCFVEERRLIAPRVFTYIAPPTRNVTLLPITRNVTRYNVVQNRIVNSGPSVERIEKVTAQRIPRMRLVTPRTPDSSPGNRVRDKEREVLLYRPGVARPGVQPPQIRPPVPGGQTSQPRPAAPAPGAPSVLPPPQETGQRRREPPTQGPGTLPEQPAPPRPTGVPSVAPHRRQETEPWDVEDKRRRERQIPAPGPQQLSPPQIPQGLPAETAPRVPDEKGRPPREAQPTLRQPRQQPERERQQPAPLVSPQPVVPSVPQGASPLPQRPAEPPRIVTPQPVPSAAPSQSGRPQVGPPPRVVVPQPAPQQPAPSLGVAPQASPPPRPTSPPATPRPAPQQSSAPQVGSQPRGTPSQSTPLPAAPQRVPPQVSPQPQTPGRPTREDSQDPRKKQPPIPGQQPPVLQQ